MQAEAKASACEKCTRARKLILHFLASHYCRRYAFARSHQPATGISRRPISASSSSGRHFTSHTDVTPRRRTGGYLAMRKRARLHQLRRHDATSRGCRMIAALHDWRADAHCAVAPPEAPCRAHRRARHLVMGRLEPPTTPIDASNRSAPELLRRPATAT